MSLLTELEDTSRGSAINISFLRNFFVSTAAGVLANMRNSNASRLVSHPQAIRSLSSTAAPTSLQRAAFTSPIKS